MQKLQHLGDTKFPRGYNDKLEPDALPSGYCALIQNGFLDYQSVRERTGYSLVGADTGENKPNLLLHSYESGSFNQLLKINNDATDTAAWLYYKNPAGAWTKVLTASWTPSTQLCAVTANGKVYITNGIDVVRRWNGTTLTDIAAIPRAKFLVWFHNFLWALNTTTYTSRAYFSMIGDPETWGASDFMDVSPEDNDEITGATVLKDELIIGKYYRIYAFMGWSEASFSIASVNESLNGYGVVSHRSFCNIGNDLLFGSYLGNNGAVRSIVRTQYATTIYGDIVSDDIEGTMNGASFAQLSKMASVYDGKIAWFFYPTGSNAFNDGCVTYDPQLKGWAKHTGFYAAHAIVSAYDGQVKVYFADSRNSKVYVMDDSNDDNGQPIDFIFKTREWSPDWKRVFKFKYIWTEYDGVGGASTLDLSISVDSSTMMEIENLDLTPPSINVFPMTFPFTFLNTTTLMIRTDLALSGVHRKIQLQYAKSDTGPRTRLFSYEVSGYPRALRDSK